MAESVGPRQGGGDGFGTGRDRWPSEATTPPLAPAAGGDAPTEPELAPTDELPATPAPYFHDVSGYPPPGAPGSVGSPSFPAYGQPGYPPPPYGYPPPIGGAYGPYAYAPWSPPKTNGLAIASMVCGICAFVFCQVFAIPGLFLGLRARRQIRESGGAETGDPFALAGIILSGIGLFLLVALIGIYVVLIGVTVAGT